MKYIKDEQSKQFYEQKAEKFVTNWLITGQSITLNLELFTGRCITGLDLTRGENILTIIV
jgi:hypothetical protein